MKKWYMLSVVTVVFISLAVLTSCSDDEDPIDDSSGEFTDLLSNQIDEVIIPTMVSYQGKARLLNTAASTFESAINESNLTALRSAYQEAYLAYQAAAVHDYFITSNLSLVSTTNLYPVDVAQLATFIANGSFDFNTSSQQRASGFPALDFMLYGSSDIETYFNEDANRLTFLVELTSFIESKADDLVSQWSTSDLRSSFISSSGTGLGSAVSTQLNKSLVYYEDHIRENKVGIPIGRLGPNDSPVAPDPTKIEAYYQSQVDGDDSFALSLVKAAIEEMEDIYLGTTSADVNEQGYDNLAEARGQSSIDSDIKAQFQTIYAEIDSRASISGDIDLYTSIQNLVTLYKSDLFPVLNVQDADGANDGD